MRCVRCGHDSKHKDRSGKICPGCHKRFAFEPQDGDPYTDPAFQGAIDRVSSQGAVRFDADHLYYEVARLRRGPQPIAIVLAIGAIVGSAFIALVLLPGMLAILASGGIVLWGGLGLYVYVRTLLTAVLPRHEFERYLERWNSAHGPPPDLIRPAKQIEKRSARLDAELEAYSFDRVVITDTADTAEVLLANGFHFENNCAVLSITGHPAHAFETVRAMLRQNPRIEVFALHDCTVEGCKLAHRLKNDPAWFLDAGTVYDVGLRPAQAKAYQRYLTPAGFAVTEKDPALTPVEAKWLSQHELAIAVIRPEQLIKRLFRAMNTMAEEGKVDEATGITLWSTHASTSDGGGDSFG